MLLAEAPAVAVCQGEMTAGGSLSSLKVDARLGCVQSWAQRRGLGDWKCLPSPVNGSVQICAHSPALSSGVNMYTVVIMDVRVCYTVQLGAASAQHSQDYTAACMNCLHQEVSP